MNNKKRIKILGIIGFLLLVIMIGIYVKYSNKEYFIGIDYSELSKMIDKKEDFVLCVSASTCSHCAMYKPKLKNVAEKYKVVVYYTDIDLYNDSDKKKFDKLYGIDGTPTTLFFKDGKEISLMSRVEGDISEDDIVKNLKKHEFINEE